ncbi:YkgJ family cysteine cluster protein [Thermodesulfobacteriota bacterium]
MKRIESAEMNKLPGKRLGENDRFAFHCRPGLSCFNRCCRNLNLFLYPYDVIRLKNSIGIDSDQFLDKHVDIVLRDANYFPEVLLKMAQNKEKTCPFLAKTGCGVYSDRPRACRTFPLEQGLLYEAEAKETRLIHIWRPPDFCLGQGEEKAWTPDTWIKDQEAHFYNKMMVRWTELKRLFESDPWGFEGPEGPKGRMAFMATYNLDRFRDFIFNSTFRQRYKVKTDILKKIRKDDVETMKLGFDWVKLFLWGMQSKMIKPR